MQAGRIAADIQKPQIFPVLTQYLTGHDPGMDMADIHLQLQAGEIRMRMTRHRTPMLQFFEGIANTEQTQQATRMRGMPVHGARMKRHMGHLDKRNSLGSSLHPFDPHQRRQLPSRLTAVVKNREKSQLHPTAGWLARWNIHEYEILNTQR
ncbi:hypothetical protein MASR1M59_13760 [Melaminivora sp.]